jgi:ADP-ribose pyrophosphatase YjhB (NUDIX family)
MQISKLEKSQNESEFIFLNNDQISIYNKSQPLMNVNSKSKSKSKSKSNTKREKQKDVQYGTNIDSQSKKKYKNIYCVNCGEKGHVVKECCGPITSFGIIAFKIVYSQKDEKYDKNNNLSCILNNLGESELLYNSNEYPKTKFLMIQRKDTMGYIDFIRGKYPDNEDEKELYLLSVCFQEMTQQEKSNLLNKSFNDIWDELWINHDSKCYKNEYTQAKKKFEKLNIKDLISKSTNSYMFQEFGFPKGRRNMKETNISCAEREFYEETGYTKNDYDFIKNYPTIQEEFIGTNGIRYRHIYYLVKMKDNVLPPSIDKNNIIQTGEVQNIGWFTVEECLKLLRPYDIAKKNVIKNVYTDLVNMENNYVCTNFYYNQTRKNIVY